MEQIVKCFCKQIAGRKLQFAASCDSGFNDNTAFIGEEMPWWKWKCLPESLNQFRPQLPGIFLISVSQRENRNYLHDNLLSDLRCCVSTPDNINGTFSVSELQNRCPNVSMDMIRRIMKKLKSGNMIECLGRGQSSRWQKTDEWQLGNIDLNR